MIQSDSEPFNKLPEAACISKDPHSCQAVADYTCGERKRRGLLKEDGYDDYWSCSTVKKGYSGTAVFVKQRGKKQAKQTTIGNYFSAKPKAKGGKGAKREPSELPISTETLTLSDVSFDIGKDIDNEGRTNICDFPFATITNVYVPNSGQDLKRLDYRTSEWDKDFLGNQHLVETLSNYQHLK